METKINKNNRVECHLVRRERHVETCEMCARFIVNTKLSIICRKEYKNDVQYGSRIVRNYLIDYTMGLTDTLPKWIYIVSKRFDPKYRKWYGY